MFVFKMGIDGGFQWIVRIGADKNDNAYGLYYYKSNVYVVGSSSSTGWTSSNTDMVILRLSASDGAEDYLSYMGGTQDDLLFDVVVPTDGFAYAVGYTNSAEITGTNGIDVAIVQYSQGGGLGYFKYYGGSGTDQPTNIRYYGAYLYILGWSETPGLSAGFTDIFIMSLYKGDGSIKWVKYIGTSLKSELP